MNEQNLLTFHNRYTTLSGHVHFADTVKVATNIVMDLLQESQVKRVAIAALQKQLDIHLRKLFQERGIELVYPCSTSTSIAHMIDTAEVGISGVTYGIAQTGTLVEVTADDADRLVSTLPATHIAILREKDIFETLDETAPFIRKAFEDHSQNCTVSFISGPSRTGDIAMQLTLGVHGPKVSHVIIIRETEDEG